jgi:uncharacterized membrane protein
MQTNSKPGGNRHGVCQICGRHVGRGVSLIPGAMVRPGITDLIRRKFPDWSADGLICEDDLNAYRSDYVREILLGEVTSLENEVIESLRTQDLISSHLEDAFQTTRTRGERWADHIAGFGGSWTFIALFGMTVLGWMVVNSVLFMTRPFDPYPYILLNLILSCLAAVQAPVIMMSQKRQEVRDRLRAANDYQVNLKAELEIRHLHQKIDHLLSHQWQRLVEIQQVQLELMRELRSRPRV